MHSSIRPTTPSMPAGRAHAPWVLYALAGLLMLGCDSDSDNASEPIPLDNGGDAGDQEPTASLDAATPMNDGGDDVDGPDSAVPPNFTNVATETIDAPAPVGCVTDVSPGDHTFECGETTFQVMVDERCTEYACGLIFDVHGAAMTGNIMRTNDRLHELGSSAGFLVVHPTAPASTWSWDSDPPDLAEFMDDMIEAFHVNPERVHMTGFSMGAAMTFWFLCNRTDVLASVGPVTGASAEQVVNEKTGDNCIASIDADWKPRVPILFMSGTMDRALTTEAAQARTDGLVSRLGLTGGDEIDAHEAYRRRRWTGDDGMVLDFLTHDYASGALGGHCIPGGPPEGGIFACGPGDLDWGATVLQWFIDHPRSP